MEWMPIESAPRDYTQVLIYCPHAGVTMAQFEPRAIVPHWNFDVWDLNPSAHNQCFPTHWMPLPTPPAKEET